MKNTVQNQGHKPKTSPVKHTLMSMRKAWVGVGLLSCFVNILMLTGPLYMLQVYDRVISSQSMSTLVALSMLMVLMYAFMGLLDFFRSRILVRIGNYVESELGERTFHIWLKQGLQGAAAEKHRPLSDLARIKSFLTGAAPSTFFDIPWTPIYIAAIFMLNWTLGVFAVVGAIIVLIIAIAAELATRKPQADAQMAKGASNAFSGKCHSNAEAVIAMGMGNAMASQWLKIKNEGVASDLSASDISGGASAFSKAFRMFMQSAILGMGAALALQQIVSPGAMIAGSIILGRALAPIQMIIGQWRGYIETKNSYNRLSTFYEAIPEDEEMVPLPAPTGILKVENMTAGPPGSPKATLKNIKFEINPGDGLCVLGPSASGKSTLARLLVGAWMPQMGAVRLDGATFDQWSADDLGGHIGYLPQQIELFDGTVGENIARFSKGGNPNDIVIAAHLAGVHELVLGLPDGYNTKIGTGGTILSVGQVQRVALARAMYGDPCLVVLDEPNSNLDAQGDEALTNAIRNLRQRGKTVVIITHRQSAMEAVNKVLILRNGAQVKFGQKEDLFKAKQPAQTTPGQISQMVENRTANHPIQKVAPPLQAAPVAQYPYVKPGFGAA